GPCDSVRRIENFSSIKRVIRSNGDKLGSGPDNAVHVACSSRNLRCPRYSVRRSQNDAVSSDRYKLCPGPSNCLQEIDIQIQEMRCPRDPVGRRKDGAVPSYRDKLRSRPGDTIQIIHGPRDTLGPGYAVRRSDDSATISHGHELRPGPSNTQQVIQGTRDSRCPSHTVRRSDNSASISHSHKLRPGPSNTVQVMQSTRSARRHGRPSHADRDIVETGDYQSRTRSRFGYGYSRC